MVPNDYVSLYVIFICFRKRIIFIYLFYCGASQLEAGAAIIRLYSRSDSMHTHARSSGDDMIDRWHGRGKESSVELTAIEWCLF